MNEDIQTLYSQLLDRYVKITWTHKIHEKQADIYNNTSIWNKRIIAALTVATTTSAVATVFNFCGLGSVTEVVTALLSAISSYFILCYKDEPLDNKAKINKKYAIKCLELRNACESLLTDVKAKRFTTVDEIAYQRDLLEQKAISLRESGVPPTTSKAVKLAEKALKIKRDNQTSKEEISVIVPEGLQTL